jgi:hypothetical protein
MSGDVCRIDEAACVECYVCLRSAVCAAGAIRETPLEWPRIIRHQFSAVRAVQKGTGKLDGRGTAEMKTNDVTGRYGPGEAGFTVDVGRPGLGAGFVDIEKIAMAVAKTGARFEPANPATKLMADPSSGRFRADVRHERVLSCILEFKIGEDRCLHVIDALKKIAPAVNTVFSVGCISRCREDGTAPVRSILDEAGIRYRPNGKVNIGLASRSACKASGDLFRKISCNSDGGTTRAPSHFAVAFLKKSKARAWRFQNSPFGLRQLKS